ncbi:hypothetical protein DAMA08_017740 [Martiniozyma asiatica (nom. inval.)]|nr:hypothetical protein DAMA08_017740 [Martiniozyma asiatica]
MDYYSISDIRFYEPDLRVLDKITDEAYEILSIYAKKFPISKSELHNFFNAAFKMYVVISNNGYRSPGGRSDSYTLAYDELMKFVLPKNFCDACIEIASPMKCTGRVWIPDVAQMVGKDAQKLYGYKDVTREKVKLISRKMQLDYISVQKVNRLNKVPASIWCRHINELLSYDELSDSRYEQAEHLKHFCCDNKELAVTGLDVNQFNYYKTDSFCPRLRNIFCASTKPEDD